LQNVIKALVFYVLSGCAMVGPRSISLGRADYNEAIERTDEPKYIVISAYFAVRTRNEWGIGITMRSTYDLYFHGQFKYLGWRLNNEKRIVGISKCC